MLLTQSQVERAERYAAIASGIMLAPVRDRSRSQRSCWARYFVADALASEGWTYDLVGRFLGRNRTSVNHMVGMVNQMKQYPVMYAGEYERYLLFQEKISDAIQ